MVVFWQREWEDGVKAVEVGRFCFALHCCEGRVEGGCYRRKRDAPGGGETVREEELGFIGEALKQVRADK